MFSIKDKAFRKILEIPDVSFVEAKFHRESSSIILQAEKGVEDLLYRFYLDDQRLEKIPLPVSVIDQLEVSKKRHDIRIRPKCHNHSQHIQTGRR